MITLDVELTEQPTPNLAFPENVLAQLATALIGTDWFALGDFNSMAPTRVEVFCSERCLAAATLKDCVATVPPTETETATETVSTETETEWWISTDPTSRVHLFIVTYDTADRQRALFDDDRRLSLCGSATRPDVHVEPDSGRISDAPWVNLATLAEVCASGPQCLDCLRTWEALEDLRA